MRRRNLTRCIPAVSLLSLSVTNCDTTPDDPEQTLEGSWKATIVRGEDFPIAGKEYSGSGEYQEYTGYSRTEALLNLYGGTTGYLDRVNTFITALSRTVIETRRVYTAKVIEDMRPSYRIRLTRTLNYGPANVLYLNCTQSDNTLECDEEISEASELEDTTWQFTRGE